MKGISLDQVRKVSAGAATFYVWVRAGLGCVCVEGRGLGGLGRERLCWIRGLTHSIVSCVVTSCLMCDVISGV